MFFARIALPGARRWHFLVNLKSARIFKRIPEFVEFDRKQEKICEKWRAKNMKFRR